MKTLLRILALGLLLSVPSAAQAEAPSLSPISDMTLNAGGAVTVNVVAVDPDGDPISLTSTLPGFAVLNSPTSGTGIVVTTMTLNPLAADAGTHSGSVTATAGSESDTETFMVTVAATGSDLAPTVTAPATQTVTEGDLLSFVVTAADADLEAISSLVATGLPTGATFTPNGTYTSGTFTWTPTAGQAGQYDVVFTAANALTGSASTHIMVLGSDLGPVSIASIDDISVAEGGSATLNVSVSDPDSGTINLSASGLPAFATLNPPTTSTGTGSLQTTITIAPGAGTAGSYPVTLTATSGSETDTEEFTITVTGEQNAVPVVEAPDTRTVDEGQMLTFTVTATDADADTVALTASGMPTGAAFTDHGDNSGTFTWTPGSEQSGTYTVTFTGDDGNGGTDTDVTVITVNDVSGDFETHATLIGRYNSHRKFLCFRVRQDDAEFDLRLVTLSSITLAFEGRTIDGLAGKTHIGYECDECNECDEGDEGDDDCDECDDDDDCDDREDCEADHLRACFAMSALRDLFDGDVVDGLLESEIRGTLSTGETFVATLGGKHLADQPGNGHDRGEGEGDKKSLKLQVRPNPLNPKADITFTLARAGQVRIALYDLRGRLVKTILDENRTIGDHTVAWDGSSGEGGRVASGVYFLRIQAQQGEDVQRVTVLK